MFFLFVVVTAAAAVVDNETQAGHCSYSMATTRATRELAFTFAVAIIYILLIEYPRLTQQRINCIFCYCCCCEMVKPSFRYPLRNLFLYFIEFFRAIEWWNFGNANFIYKNN